MFCQEYKLTQWTKGGEVLAGGEGKCGTYGGRKRTEDSVIKKAAGLEK